MKPAFFPFFFGSPPMLRPPAVHRPSMIDMMPNNQVRTKTDVLISKLRAVNKLEYRAVRDTQTIVDEAERSSTKLANRASRFEKSNALMKCEMAIPMSMIKNVAFDVATHGSCPINWFRHRVRATANPSFLRRGHML